MIKKFNFNIDSLYTDIKKKKYTRDFSLVYFDGVEGSRPPVYTLYLYLLFTLFFEIIINPIRIPHSFSYYSVYKLSVKVYSTSSPPPYSYMYIWNF